MDLPPSPKHLICWVEGERRAVVSYVAISSGSAFSQLCNLLPKWITLTWGRSS